MENSTFKSRFHYSPLDVENGIDRLPKVINISTKAVKSTMTSEQVITPPARVWDKIEKILDEQENRRRSANHVITSSFANSNFLRRKKVYLATVAGLTIVGGLMWIIL